MKRVLSLIVCFALVLTPVLQTVAEDSAGVFTETFVSQPVSISMLEQEESPKASGSTAGFADEVLRLVNIERDKQGLKPLSGGYVALNNAAAIRAQEQTASFGHTRPNKSSCFTVFAETGVSQVGAAENVAYGQTTPAQVMNAWMNSDSHRPNILAANYNYMGVGCYYSTKTNTYYWAQMFTATYPKLSSKNFSLDLGEVEAFGVVSNPVNNRFTIKYGSSNPAVATISTDGTVQALTTGTTVLTAEYTDPSTMMPDSVRGSTTATLTVTPFVPATSVSITQPLWEVNKGTAQKLSVVLSPSNANPSVTWSSDRPEVAKVDSQGLVTAVAVGDAVLTVRTKSGMTASCKVRVVQNATKVALMPLALTLEKGVTQQMSAQVLPLDHTEGESIEWSSSAPNVASVDARGMVTTLATGDAVITARVPSGRTGTAQVKVVVATLDFGLEESSVRMKKEETYHLNPELEPVGATGRVAFGSSNTKVAKVAADGTITAVAPGKTIILAKADNGMSVRCTVTVWCDLTSISLGTAQTVNKGKTVCLTPSVRPSGNGAVLTWSTRMPENTRGNPDAVATITQSGMLTAVGSGSVIVRVEAPNGLYAEKLITVKAPATKIALNKTTLNMHVGDEGVLTAWMEPEDCTDNVTWSTTNKKVATVDASGMVTAVGIGKATITCKAKSGKNMTCAVTVYADAEGLAISSKNDTLTVGKATFITVRLTPTGANTPVTFESNNPDVTVTAAGKVTASSAAKNTSVTITATTLNGVKTSKTFQIISPATGVTLSKNTLALHVDDESVLSASLLPAGCTDRYSWSSSNSGVAKVDQQGKVKAVKVGKTYVTCKAQSGKTGICQVIVYEDAEAIIISTKPTSIKVGKSLKLGYKLTPAAANTPVTFKSSNEKIAKVNQTTGTVTAVSAQEGTSVTITATTLNGVVAEYVLEIKAPATKATLDTTTLKMQKGEEYTLRPPSVAPVGCTDTWTWGSSNPKAAKVDAAGKITAVGRGTANIICKMQSGRSAVCKVTVWEEPLTLQITAPKQPANIGTTLKLATKMNPISQGVPLTWTTSSSATATVSQDGVVTPLAPGPFTVTVRAPGGAQSSVSMLCVQPATWIGVNQSAVCLPVGETYTLGYRLLPANSNDSVSFASNSATVAVSADGVITAKKAGTARITIKTGSGKTVICTVTVVRP